MPEAIQTTGPEDEEQEVDTDAEFQALLADSQEGAERLKSRAAAARESGKTDIADVYDEVRGTVMSLMSDFIASTAGAIVSLEDSVAAQEVEESQLLPEDAAKYLTLFEQYAKLLDELAVVIPAGSEGDAQRDIFATLRRMTDGLAAFTQEITIAAAGDDEPEDEDEDDDAAPESE
jgi:hypothetical protein